MVISETKLDESFPVNQFRIPGFTTPFRGDRKVHGGGIMAFVREDISSKLISDETLCIEGMFIELNFHKKNGYSVAPTLLAKTPFQIIEKY